MKKEYKRCIRVSRQRRWSASNNASIDASIDASISLPPLSPKKKESSKEKKNTPNSPTNPPPPPLGESCAAKAARGGVRVARVEEMFVEFWAAYPRSCPRRIAKAKCRDKYFRLVRDAGTSEKAEELHAAILAGIERYKESDLWMKDCGQYICAPLVFLNQRRWKDEELGKSEMAGGRFVSGKYAYTHVEL